MRYQLWDTLVFPATSRIPLQEFKASCHVVPEPVEPFHLNPNAGLIPTVSGFIPAMSTGTGFRISVHSWNTPEVSRYTQSFSKHPDEVMYEARVYIDGKLVGTKYFTRTGVHGEWPVVIDTSLDVDKNGDLEPLKFPEFHRELLSQSYWSAGDDFGRIKVVIAEGFQRCSVTTPFERIKNIVAFTFQHAPIEILESSSIAWPNPGMWRQIPFAASYLHQPQARQPSIDFEAHGHSPRQKLRQTKTTVPPPTMAPILNLRNVTLPKPTTVDPFYEPEPTTNHWRHVSTSDISMPDYSLGSHVSHASHASNGSDANNSRTVTDPTLIMKNAQVQRHETLTSVGAFDAVCEALMPNVPANTPAEVTPSNVQAKKRAKVSMEAAEVQEGSDFNNRPIAIPSSIKGRKENLDSPNSEFNATPHTTIDGTRKVAQPFGNTTGNKRQRVITPASFKAIDEEDEPRSSPSTRLSSRNQNQDGTQEPRRALNDIENLV